MDIVGQEEVREAHVSRGEAECYMMLRELPRGQLSTSIKHFKEHFQALKQDTFA